MSTTNNTFGVAFYLKKQKTTQAKQKVTATCSLRLVYSLQRQVGSTFIQTHN
jgi:hypothetical protein